MPEAVFITPADQQTFKWYADRAEVACWKDMPQDAARIIQWDQRLTNLYRAVPQQLFGVLGLYDHEILELAAAYGAGYLVVETRFVARREAIGYPPDFERVYPPDGSGKSTFTVYRLPARQSAQAN